MKLNYILIFILISSVSTNVFFFNMILANGTWVSKINNSVTITMEDLNELYKATILLNQNHLVPLKEEELNPILENKQRKILFLRSLEDQILITEKAKEKELYTDEDLELELASIFKVIKYQFILKKYIANYIYPRIKVTDSEINAAYQEALKTDRFNVSKVSSKDAKQFLRKKLESEKINSNLQLYLEKLRLEAKIIQNKQLLN